MYPEDFTVMKIFYLFLFFILNQLNAQITIDANFESGNLQSIEQIDSVSFNVTTNEDIGGRWFYYRMNGVIDKEVRVRITNSDVNRAMYSYDNKTYERFTDDESSINVFIKEYEQDTVYVAYYTPYTFTYLQQKLIEWQQNDYVVLDTIGFTDRLLPIQEMIITDATVPDSLKQTVWIHARTHPSETPSSWHFDGIVQELLSGKEEINYYLKRIKFHLIPFTNPDGVFYGRSRTNYDGIDLESNWDKSEAETSTEVKVLRARMKELNDEKPFSVFLNLHSQVSSYCTFWVHYGGSTSDEFYRQEIQFSYLNISDNQYFGKEDLRFSNLRSVYPEGWLWDNYGAQVMALTYETPYDNYSKSNSDIWVTNDNLFDLGSRTIFSIAEYLQISHPKRYLMDNSIASLSGNYSTSSDGLEFFGDNFVELDPNDNSASATFTSEELPEGQYDVSGWWASNNENSYETKFEIIAGGVTFEDTTTQKLNGGQWNYLKTIELSSDGIISIELNSNSTGKVVADAFRLEYVGPVTSVENEILPNEFILFQNYPNPFNPTTTIKYSIPVGDANFASTTNTILKVYDILGKEIITLVDEHQSSGTYDVNFDATNFASGTYIYRLQVGSYAETKKMLLIK